MDETTHIPHPAWSYPAVIYELNVRQLTPEGTFAAAEKHLPRLRELGIERDQLEAVAKQARYDGAALYNATEVTIEDAMEILEAVY